MGKAGVDESILNDEYIFEAHAQDYNNAIDTSADTCTRMHSIRNVWRIVLLINNQSMFGSIGQGSSLSSTKEVVGFWEKIQSQAKSAVVSDDGRAVSDSVTSCADFSDTAFLSLLADLHKYGLTPLSLAGYAVASGKTATVRALLKGGILSDQDQNNRFQIIILGTSMSHLTLTMLAVLGEQSETLQAMVTAHAVDLTQKADYEIYNPRNMKTKASGTYDARQLAAVVGNQQIIQILNSITN